MHDTAQAAVTIGCCSLSRKICNIHPLRPQIFAEARDVMSSFQPKPETENVRSLFLSFLRSVSWTQESRSTVTRYHKISQHITTYYNISQHITTYHNILQHITTYHNILQHIRTYHNISQHITSYHNISQHTTTYQNISQHITTYHNI